MSSIITGIDIGTRNVRIVVAEKTSREKGGIKVIGIGSAEAWGLRGGYVVNIKEAKKSVRDALLRAEKDARLRIRTALVGIGGLSLESSIGVGSTLISRVDGEVTTLDVDRAVATSREKTSGLANKKIIHEIVLQYKLDGKEVLGRPLGMKGMKLEAKTLFITVLAQHLYDFVEAVESAGVSVTNIAASPIAESLVTLTETQRVAGCVLVNVGAETVSLAVFENDKPTSLEVFPIGSINITHDIALGLKISLEEAEDIKTGTLSNQEYSRKKLEEIIEARLSDIFELVEAHLKKIGRSGLLPAGIILTGGGSGIATIEDLAKASLRLPARVALPRLPANTRGELKNPAWSVAYGLCIFGLYEPFGMESNNKKTIDDYLKSITAWGRQFLP